MIIKDEIIQFCDCFNEHYVKIKDGKVAIAKPEKSTPVFTDSQYMSKSIGNCHSRSAQPDR